MVVDRMGTRFSMILGGCSGAINTLLYWAIARQFLPISHVVACLSVLAVAICLSCGLIIGSIFKLTLICGGPEFKGSAVGIAKGLVGLGAGVYATIFQALRTSEESALDFIPVIAVFFIVCAVFPAWLLLLPEGQCDPNQVEIRTTNTHFRILYGSLFLLASTILWSSISDIMVKKHEDLEVVRERDYKKVATILLIWLGPIWSLLYLPKRPREEFLPLLGKEQSATTSGTFTVEDDNINESDPLQAEPTTTTKEEEGPKKDLNLMEMLQTLSAWLMLWTTVILVGSGTTKTNNVRI